MFGSKRNSYSDKKGFPWLFLIIFAAAVLVITVIIGSILPLFLNEAALNALRGTETEADDAPPPSEVKKLHAYAYTLGAELDGVFDNPHASVSLNAPSGKLSYSSHVSSYLNFSSYRKAPLFESMEALDGVASYISGVFYPLAPTLTSPEERDARALCELALMREFLRAGGDEILIRDLPFETAELSDILTYLETVKSGLGEAPLVVAVPLSVLQSGNSHRLLMRLSEFADRISLDLSEADSSMTAEQWLAECDFFLTQYGMRLLLSETQKELIAAAQTKKDLQTYTRIPEAEQRT